MTHTVRSVFDGREGLSQKEIKRKLQFVQIAFLPKDFIEVVCAATEATTAALDICPDTSHMDADQVQKLLMQLDFGNDRKSLRLSKSMRWAVRTANLDMGENCTDHDNAMTESNISPFDVAEVIYASATSAAYPDGASRSMACFVAYCAWRTVSELDTLPENDIALRALAQDNSYASLMCSMALSYRATASEVSLAEALS